MDICKLGSQSVTVIRFFGKNVENRVFSTSWKCVLCAYLVCPNVGLMGKRPRKNPTEKPKSAEDYRDIGIAGFSEMEQNSKLFKLSGVQFKPALFDQLFERYGMQYLTIRQTCRCELNVL